MKHTLNSARKQQNTVYYVPQTHGVVSAAKFSDLIKNHRSKIKSYSISIPRIGDKEDPFGSFVVEYSTPIG